MDSISRHVSTSLQTFKDLLAATENSSRGSPDLYGETGFSGLSSQTVQNEFARFKVWAGNIGAHRSGRTSLDYRLRDASNIRSQVVTLLRDLTESLNDATSIYHGERIPWDQEPPGQYGSEDIEDDDGLMAGLTGPEGLTELAQISSDITEAINCLFRLTVSIQNPAPHDRFKRKNWVDASYFEERDISHVRDMFPLASETDSERLGKAISRRRQYFKYREIRHHKMRHGLDGASDDDEGAPSTIASSIPKHLKGKYEGNDSQTEHHALDEDNVSVSAWTDTTFGDSLIAGDRPRIPRLPTAAIDGPFECPFCYMLISTTTSRAWTKHVLADLRPYICLSPDCAMSSTDYEGRHQWMQHVLGNHWKIWSCDDCGDKFDSANELRTHFLEVHPTVDGHQGVQEMVEAGEKPKALNALSKCPLCQQQTDSAKDYSRHVGHHQRDLALFALPNLQSASDPLAEHSTDSDSHDPDEGLPRISPPLQPLLFGSELHHPEEVMPRGSPLLQPLHPTLGPPDPLHDMERLEPSLSLGDGALTIYLDGHRLKNPSKNAGENTTVQPDHNPDVSALRLGDSQALRPPLWSLSDSETDRQFLLLAETSGWNNLPDAAKHQMLAYPVDKKRTLIQQAQAREFFNYNMVKDLAQSTENLPTVVGQRANTLRRQLDNDASSPWSEPNQDLDSEPWAPVSIRIRLAPDTEGKNIPLDATWTKVSRSLISAEVLEKAGVRYEARPEFVAVLGALTPEQIAEYARQSAEVRNRRLGKSEMTESLTGSSVQSASGLPKEAAFTVSHNEVTSARPRGERGPLPRPTPTAETQRLYNFWHQARDLMHFYFSPQQKEVSTTRQAARTAPLDNVTKAEAAFHGELGACPDCHRKQIKCTLEHWDLSLFEQASLTSYGPFEEEEEPSIRPPTNAWRRLH